MPQQPIISFFAHQARAGAAGAREDFEQMLALLAQATLGEANLVFANPGDWGIDVLFGNLNGQATILQAKYFVPGVTQHHRAQIKDSFESALRAALANEYAVTRWVLCVPSSMDGPTTQWWQGWKGERQRATGVRVELWDETRLRELLIRPEAANVREHFYNPYRQDQAPEEHGPSSSPAAVLASSLASSEPWAGGSEYRLGAAAYLLHDDALERPGSDRAWIWRESTADRISSGAGRVRLCQVEVLRPAATAQEHQKGLLAQAEVLDRLNGRHGVPRLLDSQVNGPCATIVTAHPPGLTWTKVFAPGTGPSDRLTASLAVDAARDLCPALGALHSLGATHRALHPDALFIHNHRCYLRDAGLAAMPPTLNEGDASYRAPEQLRVLRARPPGTDIYRLAAVLYHTLTGYPPSAGGVSLPAAAVLPWFPDPLDRALALALDADTGSRPASMRVFAEALEAGGRHLTQAG